MGAPYLQKLINKMSEKGFFDSPDGSEGGEDGVTVASEV